MSDNKMLIDATHPEETRVVVLRSGRVEEFDYESAARKLLRGNIYLAKVTRVEPSLQAAFVDYGGNRHGFLAFNEIHPDYYQIPVADRLALIEEEAAADAEEEAAAEARAEALARKRSARGRRRTSGRGRTKSSASEKETPEANVDGVDVTDEDPKETAVTADGETTETLVEQKTTDSDDNELVALKSDTTDADNTDAGPRTIEAAMPAGDALTEAIDEDKGEDKKAEPSEPDAEVETAGTAAAEPDETDGEDDDVTLTADSDVKAETADADSDEKRDTPDKSCATGDTDENGTTTATETDADPDAEAVEEVGTEDALEELPSRPRRARRSYKIQEVIKRRQVILVQVVKEERGNKGAALTTYLSLAGRYTVLMPNTARGGGISRKITNPQDRKRLKAIAADLDVPEGMGLIIRTAGAARTKQEIRRDFEYLLRLWESVRDLTLESNAPSLVYEEGNLIKRSIRDLYNKDIDEVVVAGDESYREAKDFMKMLMPSHARNVTHYQGPEPLFTRFQIERQLNAMFQPQVTLRSGGYLVINQTEALVAIDVNSGKSTREFSIEETALNTNLEAADEIARQLKLRDLAGLIVIDFIDMEEKRNNRAVERRLKEALRNDRARIQVGRISHFGLLEMSRQRLRTGVLEGSTSQCPHCMGTGIIRSTESVALAVLRGLEDAVMAGASTPLKAITTPTVALYILNNKRNYVNDMEARHGLPIAVEGSDEQQGANFVIERGPAAATDTRPQSKRSGRGAVNMEWGFEDDAQSAEKSDGRKQRDAKGDDTTDANGDDTRRRRRRRRRGGRRDDQAEASSSNENNAALRKDAPTADNDEDTDIETQTATGDVDGSEDDKTTRRGRRRGRRGGRRTRERRAAAKSNGADTDTENDATADDTDLPPGMGPQPSIGGSVIEATVAQTDTEPAPANTVTARENTEAEPIGAPKTEAPRTPDKARTAPIADEPRLERVKVTTDDKEADEPAPEAPATPARKGWWQRRFGTE